MDIIAYPWNLIAKMLIIFEYYDEILEFSFKRSIFVNQLIIAFLKDYRVLNFSRHPIHELSGFHQITYQSDMSVQQGCPLILHADFRELLLHLHPQTQHLLRDNTQLLRLPDQQLAYCGARPRFADAPAFHLTDLIPT